MQELKQTLHDIEAVDLALETNSAVNTFPDHALHLNGKLHIPGEASKSIQ